MKILFLKERPEYFSEVAEILYHQWGNRSPARTDLSPWLGSLYVKPHFRKRGIGSKLVQQAVNISKTLRIGSLYLCTPDKQRFYERLGWCYIDEVEFRGESAMVMKFTT